MSDLVVLTVFLVVVVDPVTAAVAARTLTGERDAREHHRMLATAALVAILLLAGTALAAETILDWLDISSGAAQLAAGIVLFVPALELLFVAPVRWVKPAPDAPVVRLGTFPLGVPVFAAPWGFAAVLAYGAADGTGVTAAAVVIAVVVCTVLAALMTSPPDRVATRWLGAVAGAATALVAADLVHDGVFG